MLNQTQHLKIESDWNKIQQRARAPVEQIFNNHQFCDIDWCYSLQTEKEGKQFTTIVYKGPFTANKKIKTYANN